MLSRHGSPLHEMIFLDYSSTSAINGYQHEKLNEIAQPGTLAMVTGSRSAGHWVYPD